MDRKTVNPGGQDSPKNARRTQSFSMMQVLRDDLRALLQSFMDWLDPLMDWLLAYTRRGSLRRLFIFITVSLFLWVVLALLSHPIQRSVFSPAYQLFLAMFSADVLRHILVLWLALVLGTEMAARYLDDIFEMDNMPTALRYIWSAAFLGKYPKLTIRDGDVASEDKGSPVYLIGGPGWVDVHLENVAVFEKMDGAPHVVSPEHQEAVLLEGFERLRTVIDLRDQVIELTVSGRTQDGIPVTAKDVRLVYSIDRGFRLTPDDESLGIGDQRMTYPFSEQAVLHLVYRHGKDPLYDVMRDLIRAEMISFISRHTLSEFLTNAHEADQVNQFIPRDEITDLFYDYTQEFSSQAEEHGVRLQWIGVGTWITPAQIILDRHLEAWNLSCEARLRRSEAVLNETLRDAWVKELFRLIDEVPVIFSDLQQQGLEPKVILRRLVLTYREKLRNARDLYLNHGQPVPPELQRSIAHLSVLAAIQVEDKP